MLNLNRSVCNLCAKIFESIKNYIHHDKHKLCQEVEDGYNIVNIFVKQNLTIRPIMFYGAVLNRNTVTIGPTDKQNVLGY